MVLRLGGDIMFAYVYRQDVVNHILVEIFGIES